MRFVQSLFAGAALAAAAAMALEINDFPATVEAGKTYTVTYSPADDTETTFILRQGKNEDLSTVETLTDSATNGKFQWTVSDDFPNASDYALEIKQGDLVNYIGPIRLSGSDATSSAVPSSTAEPSSTAASTAASTAITKSTVIVTTTTASASASSSLSSNGTTSPVTLTRTTAPPSTTTSDAGVPEEATGAASTVGRPAALMLGAFAAMVYLN